jgi:hypothetical protein
MTREELFRILDEIPIKTVEQDLALNMVRDALGVEPLTDTEQRIFLAAMSKEEKVCKEVCKDGHGKDLVAVCHRIERKVKKALWE